MTNTGKILKKIRAGNDDRWLAYYEDGSLWALDETNGMPFAGIPLLIEWCRDEIEGLKLDLDPQELLDEVRDGEREDEMSGLYDWICDHYDELGHGGLIVPPRDARELALIRKGLSPQEADVIVSLEAGERVTDIAKRLGVSQQAVTDAKRRAKIKMAMHEPQDDPRLKP